MNLTEGLPGKILLLSTGNLINAPATYTFATYGSDREDEFSKIFIISLLCV